jgi:hypothetical protein
LAAQIKKGLNGMTITRLKTIVCVMTFLLSVAFTPARAQTNVSPAEARAIAEDVYIYGYPLITLEITRRVTTNTAAPHGWTSARNRTFSTFQTPKAATT